MLRTPLTTVRPLAFEVVAQVVRLQIVIGIGAEDRARPPVAALARNRVDGGAGELILSRARRAQVDDVLLNRDRVDEVQPAAAVAVEIRCTCMPLVIWRMSFGRAPNTEMRTDCSPLVPPRVDAVGRRHGAGTNAICRRRRQLDGQ